MNNHKSLKEELKLLYSEELIGDTELEQMTDNLISLATIFIKEAKNVKNNNNNIDRKESAK